MPIIIDYFQFATPTGSFPIAPLQPYQYSGISGGISSLEKSDPTIVFTNLPSGLRITNTGSTAPFDSIFVKTDGIVDSFGNENILVNNTVGSQWAGSLGSNDELILQYTSGGFWTQAFTNNFDLYVINTGSGNAGSSILDIQFQPINFETVFFNQPTNDYIFLKRGGSYYFSDGSGSFPNVFFNQLTNDSWYPVNINLDSAASTSLKIQGYSYYTNPSVAFLDPGFDGYLEYLDGSHEYYDAQQYPPPAPLDNIAYNSLSFTNAHPLQSIIPNEVMSSYTILSDNSGNSGSASIQLNNVEQFSNLADPLRKLHVVFKRPNT